MTEVLIYGAIGTYGVLLVADTIGDLYSVFTGMPNRIRSICSHGYCGVGGTLITALAILACNVK